MFDTNNLPYSALVSISAGHYAPVQLHRQEPPSLFHEDIAAVWMFSHTKRFIVTVRTGLGDELTLVITADKSARNHVLNPQQRVLGFDARPVNTTPMPAAFRHKA